MQINKIVKPETEILTTNVEGAIVFNDNTFRKLLLQGMDLNLGKDRFYFSTNQQLAEFEKTIDEVAKKDLNFLLASAGFLTKEIGRKLSPILIIARLLKEYKETQDEELRDKIKTAIFYVFDNKRPDKIANAFAYYTKITGESFKTAPTFFKRAMRNILESFPELTLKKFKMLNRTIKLKDLIKVLRPRGTDMKPFIEDDKTSKIKVEEHITATLSSDTITVNEKVAILKEQIDTIPINALIRNLNFFDKFTIEEKVKICNRLKDISKDKKAFKFFNIFDLFIPTVKDNMLKAVLDEVIYEFINLYTEYEWFKKDETIRFFQDLSGSMSYTEHDKSARFFAFVMSYCFAHHGRSIFPIVLFDMKEVAYDFKHDFSKPYSVYREYLDFIVKKDRENFSGGTALLNTLAKYKNLSDTFIISCDEVTWGDNESCSATEFSKYVKENPNKSFMLFNPAYIDGKIVSKLEKNSVRISNLNSNIFMLINLLKGNINKIVTEIKKKYPV